MSYAIARRVRKFQGRKWLDVYENFKRRKWLQAVAGSAHPPCFAPALPPSKRLPGWDFKWQSLAFNCLPVARQRRGWRRSPASCLAVGRWLC